ncbi:GNAT family N-acetyltransferase [Rhodopirellula sp. MGV]|uniref:GNAT family N-acetyltransferase n=1 Tax=Rhodopirellula sp. MGV TaxID=2023130 RepID=UPI000B97A9E7|nr:GNAT family N-acetyltransferase [Rhodopirellula sp. MGV]OYP28875.1 hypothetical protein CGZ80_25210 [Rhodopirellula sp. MGV]PNY37009.1 GNAT family N-acetyltransferase [Rhodopirellula baltica]
MTDIPLRRATESDAAAIADIYNYSVLNSTATFDTEPKTTSDREQWIRDHGDRFPVFVAEADGVVVGWGALSSWGDRKAWQRTTERRSTSPKVSRDVGSVAD